MIERGSTNRLTLRFHSSVLESEYHDREFTRNLVKIRCAILLATFMYLCFGFIDLVLIPKVVGTIWAMRAGVACYLLLSLALTYTRFFYYAQQAILTSMCFVGAGGMIVIVWLGADQGGHHYYAGIVLLIIFSYTFLGLRFVNAFFACTMSVVIYMVVAHLTHEARNPSIISNNFFIFAANLAGIFAGYTIEYYSRKNFYQSKIITHERLEIERLLLSILPGPIAERLKSHPEKIADSFPQVTVLFADLVGFTPYAATKSPEETVGILNVIFSVFDDITDQFQLEKIKTIGDAYMAVAGLPVPHAQHAEMAAWAAISMQSAIEKINKIYGQNFSLRIGLNCGSVVAGVIGKKKFIYDLWGDAVNIASRMESTGVPGGIQVSEPIYQQLKEVFRFEERGEIEVKGKGKMHTYLLVGANDNPIYEPAHLSSPDFSLDFPFAELNGSPTGSAMPAYRREVL
jgi:class 3 adenylate cyclase